MAEQSWKIRLLYWLPPLLYMGGIVALSSIPRARPPLLWEHQDKVVHFVEYMVLALLLARAVAGPHARLGPVRALGALAAAALFGALDEAFQHFVPGRHASLADLGADAAGAAAGCVLWILWTRRRASPAPPGEAEPPPPPSS
jgi:VanZ family protein